MATVTHTFKNGYTLTTETTRTVNFAWFLQTQDGSVVADVSISEQAALSNAKHYCKVYSVCKHDKSKSANEARKANAERLNTAIILVERL